MGNNGVLQQGLVGTDGLKPGYRIRLVNTGEHGNISYVGAIMEIVRITDESFLEARELSGPNPDWFHSKLNVSPKWWQYELVLENWDL